MCAHSLQGPECLVKRLSKNKKMYQNTIYIEEEKENYCK